MSTSKQTEANRQNAQKSTGPRSPEGKAASRFNALKSGIDAKSQVLPDEDPDQLEVLVAEYQERFSTATPERRLLVDTLVNSEWLLRRLTRAEAEFWQYEAHRTESEYSSNEHPIGRVLYFGDRVFDRLQRRVDAINRNYHRALKELQRLEAAEQPVECPSGAGLQACPATTPEHSDPPATEVAAPAPSQSNRQPGPQIGFVPQTAGIAPQPGPVERVKDQPAAVPVTERFDYEPPSAVPS
jgi:hypothetical protein